MTDPLLLSVNAAASLLGIARSALWPMVTRGDILSVRVGRRRLIPRRVLDAYIDRLIEQAEAARAELQAIEERQSELTDFLSGIPGLIGETRRSSGNTAAANKKSQPRSVRAGS